MKLLIAIFAFLTLMGLARSQTNKIFCYYESWSTYNSGNGQFTFQDINPNLCTHISYSFIGLNADGSVHILDTSDFQGFINLKQINPNVKLIVTMGGWNEGSTTYSTVANSDSLRANLVSNVVNFLATNGFDGFDLDWEYPTQRGGINSDYVAYVNLLRDLRAAFGTKYLLSAAVGAGQYLDGTAYNIPAINQYLDFINLMTYDFHSSDGGVTAQNSPLYASSADSDPTLNQNASVMAWINAGATPSKILMGLAFYGNSYILASASNTAVGAPTTGQGAAGPYSQEAGTLTYLEICSQLRNGWTTVFDTQQDNPYSYNNNQWVGYDNPQSITIKTQYAVAQQLGGVMMWALDMDDQHNVCGGGNFPLLTAINNVIKGGAGVPNVSNQGTNAPPAATTYAPVVTTTSAPATSAPSTGVVCTQSGMIGNPNNCSVFYQCVSNGAGGWSQYTFNCPAGLGFSTQTSSCNYLSQVTGCVASG